MNSGLSERSKSISASPIRKIFDLASQTPGLTRLEVGQPDFDTPRHIIESGRAFMDKGFIGYSQTNGLPETRRGVSERYRLDYGVTFDPDREIIITNGASGALHIVLRVLVNPGDEVLRPNPGFASYDGIIQDADGIPVHYPLLADEGFSVDIAALEGLITDKTKAIILNSPNNPTGGIIDPAALKRVTELAEKRGIFIISDEAYDKIIYGTRHSPTAAVARDKSRVITIGSASKDYAMCGWRIGFAAGDAAIVQEIVKFQSLMNICPNIVAQKAYAAALTGPQEETERMRAEYEKRRDYLVEALNKIPGFKCTKPGGAFYLFVDVSAHGENDWEFTERMIRDVKISCIPGSSFGSAGKGFIRLSFAASMDVLREAVDKLSAHFG